MKNNMRKVLYYEYERVTEGNRPYLEKTLKGGAYFHAWGVNYQEFEEGPGNYSTAIIELDSGEVKNIEAEMIEFVK